MKFVNGLVVNEANVLHELAHLCLDPQPPIAEISGCDKAEDGINTGGVELRNALQRMIT